MQEQGTKLAILTRNTMPVVQHTLKACGIDDFFQDHHIFDRDGCQPKPSPDGILRLLEMWQVAPEDAVMVGDFLYDLQSGRAAGVTTVHVDNSGGSDHWPDYTDLRVESLEHLLHQVR